MNNILNIKIEIPGLELLAQAMMKLTDQRSAGVEMGPVTSQTNNEAQSVVPQENVPVSQPVPNQVQQGGVPVSQPVTTVPVSQPIPNQVQQGAVPVSQPIPTTTVPMTHTYDELAVAASQLVNAGKQQRLFEILHGFGVNSLMELPPEKYAAFAGTLKAEGVKF